MACQKRCISPIHYIKEIHWDIEYIPSYKKSISSLFQSMKLITSTFLARRNSKYWINFYPGKLLYLVKK